MSIEKIERLISQDRIEDAFEAIFKILNSTIEPLSDQDRTHFKGLAIRIFGRYSKLCNNRISGSISYKDEVLELNLIRDSLLNLIHEMRKYSATVAPLLEKIPNDLISEPEKESSQRTFDSTFAEKWNRHLKLLVLFVLVSAFCSSGIYLIVWSKKRAYLNARIESSTGFRLRGILAEGDSLIHLRKINSALSHFELANRQSPNYIYKRRILLCMEIINKSIDKVRFAIHQKRIDNIKYSDELFFDAIRLNEENETAIRHLSKSRQDSIFFRKIYTLNSFHLRQIKKHPQYRYPDVIPSIPTNCLFKPQYDIDEIGHYWKRMENIEEPLSSERDDRFDFFGLSDARHPPIRIPVIERISGLSSVLKNNSTKPTKMNCYNPLLIDWISDNLIPNPNHVEGNNIPYRIIYNVFIAKYSRYYFISYHYLFLGNRFNIENELSWYNLQVRKGWLMEDPQPVLWERYGREMGDGVGFWIRRCIDGSYERFWAFLQRLVREYDKEFFLQILTKPTGTKPKEM